MEIWPTSTRGQPTNLSDALAVHLDDYRPLLPMTLAERINMELAACSANSSPNAVELPICRCLDSVRATQS